jgi:hypothetical protein
MWTFMFQVCYGRMLPIPSLNDWFSSKCWREWLKITYILNFVKRWNNWNCLLKNPIGTLPLHFFLNPYSINNATQENKQTKGALSHVHTHLLSFASYWRRLVIDYLNLVFGNHTLSDKYWNKWLKKDLVVNFTDVKSYNSIHFLCFVFSQLSWIWLYWFDLIWFDLIWFCLFRL